jgi:hypothetical protein
MDDRVRFGDARIGMGVVLIALGILFLVQQFFGLELGQWTWPFFIIIPGLLCFVGMALGGKSAGPLAIPGSIVTIIGLLLLYQNTFNHFESWAYAWALIPMAFGSGLMINGAWSEQPALVQSGRQLVGIGLVLFLVGFFFFELVLNIGGMSRSIVASLVLIAAGIALLLRRISPPARPIAASEIITAPQAEPAEQPASPIESVPAAPAEGELVELLAASPSDEQLNAREVAAHQ